MLEDFGDQPHSQPAGNSAPFAASSSAWQMSSRCVAASCSHSGISEPTFALLVSELQNSESPTCWLLSVEWMTKSESSAASTLSSSSAWEMGSRCVAAPVAESSMSKLISLLHASGTQELKISSLWSLAAEWVSKTNSLVRRVESFSSAWVLCPRCAAVSLSPSDISELWSFSKNVGEMSWRSWGLKASNLVKDSFKSPLPWRISGMEATCAAACTSHSGSSESISPLLVSEAWKLRMLSLDPLEDKRMPVDKSKAITASSCLASERTSRCRNRSPMILCST